MDAGLKSKTVNGVIWSTIERFSVQGVSFLITIIMARLLDPSDYGIIGMLAIFISLSYVFIDGGFSDALIQKNSNTDKDYSTVFYINLVISIIIYVMLFVSAPHISKFYNQPILTPITRVYTLNLILNSLVAVHKVKLTIALDFKTQTKISVISAVISGIAGVISAYCGFAVWAIVVQLLVQSLLNVLLSVFYVRWIPTDFIDKDSFHQLFAFGSKLLVTKIIGNVYVNLYNLIIGKKYSSQQLGLYTRATQFGQLLSTNLTSILTRVSFPVFSKVKDDDTLLLHAYQKYIKMTAFIMFPLVLCLVGIARPLILILLTEKWEGCILLLQVVCFAYLCDGLTLINLNLLYVKGRSDLALKLEVIKKAIAIVILLISMNFGVLAICYGQVLYAFIALYINTHYTKKILGYGRLQQAKDILPYLIISGIMLAMQLVFCSMISNLYLSLMLSQILGALVYVGACYLTRQSAILDAIGIIKTKVHSPLKM